MEPTLTIGEAQIYLGNNLNILPTLADNSIDSIVTDPPYELGFMNKNWDSSGIAYNVELWQECLRVLKPGGHLLAFGGSRTWHRLAVAIEDAGFEMRDSIAWLYGSGFPKSHNISKAIDKAAGAEREVIGSKLASPKGISQAEGRTDTAAGAYGGETKLIDITTPATDEAKQWDGWGTALKPAFEPIVVARKPLIGTVAENVLQYGTGGLNIDASRIGYLDINDGGDWERFKGHQSSKTIRARLDNNEGADLPERVDNGKQSGRWPANIILDEHTAQLLDEQSGQVKGAVGMKKHTNFTFDVGEHQGQTFTQGKSDIGGASRFFYVAKASKRDRNEGLDELPIKRPDTRTTTGMGTFEEKGVQPQRNFHPTVKPTSLMTYLIKLVTPPNGTVLDPFAGSGSTGKAALQNNFKFIGIELTEEYLPIIAGRLAHANNTAQGDLFE